MNLQFTLKTVLIATILIQHFSYCLTRLSTFRTDSLGVSHYQKEKLKYHRKVHGSDSKETADLNDNIGLEIYYYLKNYFYNKHKLSEAEWANLYKELYDIGEYKRKGPQVLLQGVSDAMADFFRGNATSSSSGLFGALSPNNIHLKVVRPLAEKLVNFETRMRLPIHEAEVSDRICSLLSSHLKDPYTMYISASKLRQKIKGIYNECVSTGIILHQGLRFINPLVLLSCRRLGFIDTNNKDSKASEKKVNIFKKILQNLPIRSKVEDHDRNVRNFSAGDETIYENSVRSILNTIRNRVWPCFLASAISSTTFGASMLPIENYPAALAARFSIPNLKFICRRIGFAGAFFFAVALYRLSTVLLNSVEVLEFASEQTSLRVGDRILTIDGQFVGHLKSSEVERYLNRGESGDLAHVGIFRNNTVIVVPIHRGVTVDTRIEFSLLGPVDKGLAYIQLKDFNAYTYHEVSHALRIIYQQFTDPSFTGNISNTGIVIDVRGNRGGVLVSAYDLATLFLWKGTPITQLTVGGKVEKHYSINPDMSQGTRDPFRRWCRQVKLLILVDEYTASASEVFAAAMQGNQRAVVAGSHTLAKNKAQAVIDLRDGSGLIFTIRELLDPHGLSFETGIMPDIYLHNPNDPHILPSIELDMITGQGRVDGRKISFPQSK